MAVAAGRQIAPARPVRPDAVLTREEYAQIQSLRQTAAGRVAALRQDLENLEAALAGRVRGAVAQAQQLRPRISYYRSLLAEAGQVPAVSTEMSAQEILANIGTYGLREASYNTVVPVTSPKPIDNVGEYYDAQAVYDAWILNPSIDTKIDFDKMPSQNTPFISANSRMMFQVRKQKVYYLAQNILPPGTTGTMQIWLLKYGT